jgi:hypothetical protein
VVEAHVEEWAPGWHGPRRRARGGGARCHTRFLSQNRMLIVCVPKNQVYTHTVQKMDTE